MVKLFIVFMIIGFIAVPFAGAIINDVSCSIRWDGFKTQYSLLSGCKVEIDGRMVPEKVVRFGE